jgi:hypothetical protein
VPDRPGASGCFVRLSEVPPWAEEPERGVELRRAHPVLPRDAPASDERKEPDLGAQEARSDVSSRGRWHTIRRMTDDENAALERLKAQRYTTQNRLSSVQTRLKGNPSAERRREYEARRDSLLVDRDRIAAEIKALQAKSK